MDDSILIDDIKDSTIMKPKQFKIETPIITVESDTDSHFVDVLTVVSVIAVFYILSKIVKRWIK